MQETAGQPDIGIGDGQNIWKQAGGVGDEREATLVKQMAHDLMRGTAAINHDRVAIRYEFSGGAPDRFLLGLVLFGPQLKR